MVLVRLYIYVEWLDRVYYSDYKGLGMEYCCFVGFLIDLVDLLMCGIGVKRYVGLGLKLYLCIGWVYFGVLVLVWGILVLFYCVL